jgi:hypothetical protein
MTTRGCWFESVLELWLWQPSDQEGLKSKAIVKPLILRGQFSAEAVRLNLINSRHDELRLPFLTFLVISKMDYALNLRFVGSAQHTQR